MGVLDDLKSRFGRGSAEDGQEGPGEAESFADDRGFLDDRDDSDGFDSFGEFEEPATSARFPNDLPDIPAAAGERDEDVPLVSRNDVRQYLRSLERRAVADPPQKSDERITYSNARPGYSAPMPDAAQYTPLTPAQTQFSAEAPAQPAEPAAAFAAPSMPYAAAPSDGFAQPGQAAVADAHPGYAESAFMGPRDSAPIASNTPAPSRSAVPDAATDFLPKAAPAYAPAAVSASQPAQTSFFSAPAAGATAVPASAAPAVAPVATGFTAVPDAASTLYSSDAVTHLPSTAIRELVVVNPGSFDDAEMIATALRARKQVVVTVRRIPDFLSRRVLDFAFGAASVCGASVALVANKIYALTFDAPLNQYEILSLRDRGVL